MNNSPGWTSPGSTPSDEPDRGAQEQSTQPSAPEERPGPAEQPPPPKWSKEQPPAGQWSAPAGIPGQAGPHGRSRASSSGSGGPGWNPPAGQQPPPWGGSWAPVPPAAKPGVIPLRPLGVGEILDGAVATLRAHWRTVLGISLVVAVVSQTATTIVTGLWLRGPDRVPGSNDDVPAARETLRELGNQLVGSALTSVIGLLATLIATGLLTMVVSRAVLGRSVTTGDAWREARGQLPRLLGLLLVLPVLITAIFAVGMAPGLITAATGASTVGVVLTLLGGLAAFVVSIWLWIRYSLASPALMLEKQGVFASMRRSAKLVRGAWWRVLGAQLLAALVLMIVGFMVQVPSTVIAFLIDGENAMGWASGAAGSMSWSFLIVLGIGAVIGSTITYPISAGVTVLLYVDQRIRREALDLELARAAGLPGYGADTPAHQAPAAAPAPSGTPAPAPDPTGAPADDRAADRPGAAPTDGTGEQRPTDTAPGS
ncbi:hypothetical protein SSP35_33_00050 [Streptomyces sp. NBRC 110611]|uniref:DUF7544 domain-containing protein n=1 Tax=Streptomyces sp. NBRC 110611 TaxID=1621259 RepID=UPI0008369E80|nr:hypothetical protein [Streptomyces sp. NBRC 110611]GAU71301.1 hypothetical protein SSP35_33_00050 [Streptomyces sp. NBRC 110611]